VLVVACVCGDHSHDSAEGQVPVSVCCNVPRCLLWTGCVVLFVCWMRRPCTR
jgi:hypothetical protein